MEDGATTTRSLLSGEPVMNNTSSAAAAVPQHGEPTALPSVTIKLTAHVPVNKTVTTVDAKNGRPTAHATKRFRKTDVPKKRVPLALPTRAPRCGSLATKSIVTTTTSEGDHRRGSTSASNQDPPPVPIPTSVPSEVLVGGAGISRCEKWVPQCPFSGRTNSTTVSTNTCSLSPPPRPHP